MSINIWVVFFLALSLAIYTGFQAIPMLVLMFTPRLLKFWFIEPMDCERRVGDSKSTQEKVECLRELSFLPLGIKGERILWQKPVYEVSLANVEKDTFASIILGPDDNALGIYFYTPLKGKGIVFTRAGSRSPQMEKPRISVKNIPNGEITTMFASHSQRVEALRRQGIAPMLGFDQCGRIEATYQFYESTYFKRTRRNVANLMPVFNFALAVVLLIAVLLTYFLRLSSG